MDALSEISVAWRANVRKRGVCRLFSPLSSVKWSNVSVAKVVRLRVDVDRVPELEAALRRAREQFQNEPGTTVWEVYDSEHGAHRGLGAGERTLIEVFATDAAVREHDESAAVAQLRADFESLNVEVVSVDQLSQTSSS